MSLKDLSPIKTKIQGQRNQNGLFSASSFVDQTETIDTNVKNNNISTGLLPAIDSSRQKKIVQFQSMQSSTQNINTNKYIGESSISDIEKNNVVQHYYASKQYENLQQSSKSHIPQHLNISPLLRKGKKNHTQFYNTSNNFHQNTSNNNISLLEQSQKRIIQLKQIGQLNNEFNNNQTNGIYGISNSSFGEKSYLNLQPNSYSQRYIEENDTQRKVDYKDNFYVKMFSDKKVATETDLSKIRSMNNLNEQKQSLTQRNLSSGLQSQTNIFSNASLQRVNSISSSTNKLLQHQPTQIKQISKSQKETPNQVADEFSDLKMQGEFVTLPPQNLKQTKEDRKNDVSPLNKMKVELSKNSQNRIQYINECLQDEQKREIISKSDITSIIGGVQKDFSTIKTSQNNLKKDSERKDILQLSQWFDEMTFKLLEKENFTLDSFLEEYEVIYTACINEIANQISTDCFERGQLLQKLWKIILFISQEFIKKTQKKYGQVEMQNLKEHGRIHSVYQDKIAVLHENFEFVRKQVVQKDILIRKLFQQKESSKQKYKKYELLYTILFEDYEFIERFLENQNSQNLQMRMRISNFEAQERLQISESDSKQKMKDEINKIAQSLSDQFSQQLEDQKQILQDIYEIKKNTRHKILIIEKNLDFEFKNGKIEKKGGLETTLEEPSDDIQLEEGFGQIEMCDQGTHTNDLIKICEIQTGTEDLYKMESKGIMAEVDISNKEVQATQVFKEIEIQADIKNILGVSSDNRLNKSLEELMKQYEDLKLPVESIKKNNYNIHQQIEDEYQKWIVKNKEIVNAFQQKDEYTLNDYDYLRSYLEGNTFKAKEFMTESISALLQEQQKSVMYRIETFETNLDHQIMEDKILFQTSTLKKIIPKYNELKKELNYLSQNQIQVQSQINLNPNRKRQSKFQYNKQQSLNYLDTNLESPGRYAINKQFDQSPQLQNQGQKSYGLKRQSTYKIDTESPSRQTGNSPTLKRQNTSKINDELDHFSKQSGSSPIQRTQKRQNSQKVNYDNDSPSKLNGFSTIQKQKSLIFSSTSKQNSSPILKKDASQKYFSQTKQESTQQNDDAKKVQSPQSNQQAMNNQINQLPEVSKQLRALTKQTSQQNDEDDIFGEMQLKQMKSTDNSIKLFQNSKKASETIDNIQSKSSSFHQQNVEEKNYFNEKSPDLSKCSSIILKKNSSQSEYDHFIDMPQPNPAEIKVLELKNLSKSQSQSQSTAELNIKLTNIQETTEADENNLTPVSKPVLRHQSPRKSLFADKEINSSFTQRQNDINLSAPNLNLSFENHQIAQKQFNIYNQIENQQQSQIENNPDSQIQSLAQINENSIIQQPTISDEAIKIKPTQPEQVQPKKKKLTILSSQYNINSDLSSDSESEKKEKLFTLNKDQIQDQMYDKKYLDEAAAEEALRDQIENDEFGLALKNLDSSVNNVQPNPNIYSKMRIHASTSKFTEQATEYLLKSFKEMKKRKNSNLFFKLTQIFRIFFTILQDINKSINIASQSQNKNNHSTRYHLINHFHIHLFENLMTSYGSGQMMFKKYFRIINGIYKYKKHPRINIILKFITGEYDLNDFQLFVRLFIILCPELQSNEERIIINQQKCYEALNLFLFSNFNQKQQENVDKLIQKIKIKGVQKNSFAFDLDQILELIMEQYINEVKFNKTEIYRDIYYSQDTDKIDYFDFESFKTVFSTVQCQNQMIIQNLFYQESDKILDGENLLSLQRFSLICRQNRLLSQEDQNKYLLESSEQFLKDLHSIWGEEQYNIKLRLIKVNKYDIRRRKMLNEVDIYLKDSTKSHHSLKTIHFIYNLLQQESKQLLVEMNLNQLMPKIMTIQQNIALIIKLKSEIFKCIELT